MKYLKYTVLVLSFLAVTSCNQGRIEELESEVSRLEEENEALKSQIEELENAVPTYGGYRSDYSYRQSLQDRFQEDEREWRQQNAQQHLRDAEFWRQAGDEFLYENSMRQAQQELDMMP